MVPRARTLALLVGGACLAVAIGWTFGLPELTALAVGVLSCAAIAYFWVRFATNPPTLEARTPRPSVTRGDEATLALRFDNTGTRHSTSTVFTGALGSSGARMVAVGPLRPGGSVAVEVPIDTTRRGVMHFGPLEAVCRDPLRIWKVSSRQAIGTTLTVRPFVHDPGDILGTGRHTPGEGRRTAPAHGGMDADADLVGLRPYVAGDDLRRMHWRTSARRNEPHVIQVEPHVEVPAVILVLDTRSASGDPESFEWTVEAAASVASAAAHLGRPIHLATANGIVSNHAGSHARGTPTNTSMPLGAVLDTLAEVAQHPGGDLDGVLGSLQNLNGTTVVCTADPRFGPTRPHGGDEILVLRWDGSVPLGRAASLLREGSR